MGEFTKTVTDYSFEADVLGSWAVNSALPRVEGLGAALDAAAALE